MAQVGNNVESFSGEYMIQDHDHMGESNPQSGKAKNGGRQVDQSQADVGQQTGGERNSSRQQGGERRGQQH